MPGLQVRRRPSREAQVLARLDEREWAYVTRPYRALDLSFAVRVMDPNLGGYLETLLSPFESDEPARHVYSVVDHGERSKSRFAVFFGGQRIIRTPVGSMVVSFLVWHLNRSVIAASPRYLLIHASAAAHHGSAVLFPAPMESGKTTLIAGLVQRGLHYLTDEAVAIDPTSLRVQPYPKALSIDAGSWEALADLRPEIDDRYLPYSGNQWLVPADAIRVGAVAEPCQPSLVIGPRYVEGAKTEIEPISRAQAVLLLAENSFNFPSHGAAGLETLARCVRRCQSYRLTFGSLGEACDTVIKLAERQRPGK